MSAYPHRNGYSQHSFGMGRDSSPQRRVFTEAARRLNDRSLTPQEWDMVLQARIESLLRPYEATLHQQQERIAGLEAELARYKKTARRDALQQSLEKIMAGGKKGPVVLLDGSTSMLLPLHNKDRPPFSAAIEALQSTSISRVGLWGDQTPVALDIKDSKAVDAARSGLVGGGSNLSPAIEMMSLLTAPTHLIIISDGEVFDEQKCKQLLEQAPAHLTVDAIVIKGSTRHEMVGFLRGLTLPRAPQVIVCSTDAAEIKKAINTLTRKAAPKKAPQPKHS